MEYKLPELNYKREALEPHMSRETLEYHYGKHHQAYITNLNNLIKGTEFENMSLEDIIKKSGGAIFNNAAQTWNHNLFWNILSPSGGGAPKGKLSEKIKMRWGSFDKFKDDFSKSAATNFGAGWTWLVEDSKGELSIKNTSNAGNPLVDNLNPIIGLDVWEHSYYIDYRNDRGKYIENFWKIVNWDFANRNLK